MKLLILCSEPGLRAALNARFQDHRQPVVWLEAGQALAPEFARTDEPVLVVDCLGIDGNPCAPWLTQSLFVQLMANCNAQSWVWLLLSDSRVFPVSGKRHFVEADVTAPGVRSGEQLQMRENMITENIARHIVLRTGPLIAGRGDNLLMRLLHQLRSGGAVEVPDVSRFCPTPVADVARVIAAIHDQLDCGAICRGIYHYTSTDPVTHYEFAEVMLAAAMQYWQPAEGPVQLQSMVADRTAEIFPLLGCQRIRDTFGIQQQAWRKVIPVLLKQIYAESKQV